MLHWKTDTIAPRAPPFPALLEPRSVAEGHPGFGIVSLMSGSRDFPPNAEIFSQYEEVSNVYSVVSGAVRFAKMMKDGRRQIGAFYFPGDFFGLESEERHSFSAEAIINSRVRVTKRTAFLKTVMGDQACAHEIWSETAAHLQRAQWHMSVLGRKNARERIAAFLLDMDAKLNSQGSIDLPMPRRDIADYLGLTIETVSRIFTTLAKMKIIAISDVRRIVLCNRAALGQLSES